MTEPKIPGYLTAAEVAERMGVKVATIHRDLHRKRLPEPDLRVGRSPVWKEEKIVEHLKQRASTSWNRKK